ncbi:MAG: rhomboid family intramembrane serine protease, partial [Cytophagaceae bacterium]
MMVLQFSGVLFATFFSTRQFYGLYLLSAIFSGLAFGIAYLALGDASQMVGASGSIMAVLVATATYSPDMRVRLIFFGNVKLWVLSAVILGFDIVYLFVENTGGHVAHLAGAFFGFLFVKLLQNGTDLSKPVTFIFEFFANGFRLPEKPK